MEMGGSSNRDAIPNSDTNINEASWRRNSNQYVPLAGVTRIMRSILPSHVRIADDVKETVQQCVSEFISFVTSEANEKCQRECRKTITAEDIIAAMGTLGFENYIESLTVYLNKYRAQHPEHHASFSRHNSELVQQLTSEILMHPAPPQPVTNDEE